jgi:exopolyphosphatase/guanosine-5'-triphosphate,3'-diphosphate pyrophosphatase
MSDTVAAFDCGTNSLRLLLAGPGTDGPDGTALTDLDRRTEIVRLGQGVDATGEFAPEALERTFAVTRRFAELVRAAGVPPERTRFVATSASRDARNRDEFFSGIEELVGVRPDVISGDEEARLSFAGALSRIRPAAGPVLVMDIGGGSTELIVGDASGTVASAISLDIGSVRLTERLLGAGPPTPAALAAAREQVDALLDTSGVDFASVGTWVGVAGTATTLAGVHLQLEAYDRERVHGSTIPLVKLDELAFLLSRMDVDQIKALPSMHPGRADVVTAGALIATRVGARLRVPDLLVSESDILDGIALQLLNDGRAA